MTQTVQLTAEEAFRKKQEDTKQQLIGAYQKFRTLDAKLSKEMGGLSYTEVKKKKQELYKAMKESDTLYKKCLKLNVQDIDLYKVKSEKIK
jgi:hypothetical protein